MGVRDSAHVRALAACVRRSAVAAGLGGGDSIGEVTDRDPQLPDQTLTLTNGTSIPLLGFGTWQITGDDAVRATTAALEAGYRHLDTATVYGNEAEVGRALAESGVAREDVFVTTKCPPGRAGRELETLRESLDLLRTDHVDLWLIHWSGQGSTNVDMWRAFVEAREQGLAREIGVSNFDAALIDEVTDATGVRPAIDQIEWSPLLFDAGRCRSTASVTWPSRATAPCGAAPSTTLRSSRSPSGWTARPPRSSSGGTSSTRSS